MCVIKRRAIMLSAMLFILTAVFIICSVSEANAAKKYAAPKITKLTYEQKSNGSYYATIRWKSVKGAYYQVLKKKKGGSYKVIKRIKAKGKYTSYQNSKVGNNILTYSVRRVKMKKKKIVSYGYYNKTGAITFKRPSITKLNYYQSTNGSYYAELTWKSTKGSRYLVLRKKKGTAAYKAIANVKATSDTTTFINEKVGKNKSYVYSVREYKKSAGVNNYGLFDYEGITTMVRPEVTVKFNNLNAEISWNKVDGATKYIVSRKVGASDVFKDIATLSSTSTTYKDTYENSSDEKMKALFTSSIFIDPSDNNLVYTVRPYGSKKLSGVTKENYGLFLRDGVSHLEEPSIIGLDPSTGIIKWGTVPNADGYIVMRKDGNGSWTDIATIKADQIAVTQQTRVSYSSSAKYTVKAYNKRNATTYYSGYDEGFTHSSRKYSQKVLFLGNSITYGSPYKKEKYDIFSYPRRISELTGVSYYNPSIPAATIHYKEDTSRYRLVTCVANMIAKGEPVDYRTDVNTSKFEDYDVIFIAAGTNDYLDSVDTYFGNRETDWTKIPESEKTKDLTFKIKYSGKTYTESYDYDIRTFNGAYNQIMKYIEEASLNRVLAGKKPIKVVTVDLFYSDRTTPYRNITNRDVTKNSIGKTLVDYQNEINYLNSKWGQSPVMQLYRYETRSYGIVDSSNCSTRSSDNLHFTKYTYGQYGNTMAEYLVKNVLDDAAKTQTEEQLNELKTKYQML